MDGLEHAKSRRVLYVGQISRARGVFILGNSPTRKAFDVRKSRHVGYSCSRALIPAELFAKNISEKRHVVLPSALRKPVELFSFRVQRASAGRIFGNAWGRL